MPRRSTTSSPTWPRTSTSRATSSRFPPMQRLLVYQSLWAMERRRPDGLEWSLDEKLEMIRAAGFDGAGVRFLDRDYVRPIARTLGAWGLSWQAQCYPKSVEELRPVLA